jgi:alpha-1,6-mannosyltransferase
MAAILIIAILAQFTASLGMVYVSSWNYPGGEALRKLHDIYATANSNVSVHIDPQAAMTGVSLFGEWRRPQWKYSKNETHGVENVDGYLQAGYTHLITANPDLFVQSGRFRVIDGTDGFAGLGRPSFFGSTDIADADSKALIWGLIRIEPMIYILEKIQ